MMARSTKGSNQRPHTLMQDRTPPNSEKSSCNARPDHTFGSEATDSPTRGLIPAVGVLREARALYPHNAEALAGRRLHDDPALRTIHHRRAQPFEASHIGGNVVGL